MKRLLIIVLLLSAVSCGQKDPAPGGEPVRIIFDTDLGNDIDDVLALQMLLNYEKEGRAELLGITLCKANPATIAFTDGYCRFDGRGDIPLGYAYDGVTPEDGTYLLPTLEASFGGEPLLDMEAVKATVDYARSVEKAAGKEFRFTITTNAVALTDEDIGYINREMYNVVLSIDGRKSVHDAVRKDAGGNGSFDRVLANALKLVRARDPQKSYYVRGTFTAANPDFAADALALNDYGFGQVSLEPVVLPDGDPLALREDMIGLEDVVVTGYTAMKRKDITGSVASVSAEQIARIPAYDLTTSLVGVAGIRIDGGSIRIRGTRSTNAGNDPLIVLDGIPYDETLTSINPGDIESIDILKDASSTAIYGAKGANGVILITTKQARKGETKVIYDGFVGVGVNNRGTLDVMDADEYIAFQREASRAAGAWNSPEDDSKAFFGAEIANMGKMDTDWMGRYYNQKRLWHSHSLTIASGNEKTQYKVSFNYKNNEGRYEGDRRDYFYLTTDLTHQVLPFLKVGISNRAFYNVSHDKPDMFDTFLHMSPLTPIYNEDGSYNEYPFGDPFVKNPYMNETDGAYEDKTEEWKIYMRFFAQVGLCKGLTFNTNFAYTPAFSSRGYYYDNRSVGYTDERNVAALFQRKDVVVVLEQDNALALDLSNFRFARSLQLGNAVVFALKITRIAFGFALSQRADDLGGRRAERRVNLTGTFSGDDVARKADGAQSRRDVQKRFLQRSLR